jgi:hypothetical protein
MTAENRIRELAAYHGITADRAGVDDWTDRVSELSGEDGQPSDEVEQMLINLGRAELIEEEEAAQLHGDYLRERHGWK